MAYKIILARQAHKDGYKLKSAGLVEKAEQILSILEENPWQTPPSYEKLTGELAGMYSRRINIKHRLVYTVDEAEKTIHVLSLWTHYEGL
jgi:Txe/YoeB family toxin of toxin-antitoxin system